MIAKRQTSIGTHINGPSPYLDAVGSQGTHDKDGNRALIGHLAGSNLRPAVNGLPAQVGPARVTQHLDKVRRGILNTPFRQVQPQDNIG